jgi:hypothetical protein
MNNFYENNSINNMEAIENTEKINNSEKYKEKETSLNSDIDSNMSSSRINDIKNNDNIILPSPIPIYLRNSNGLLQFQTPPIGNRLIDKEERKPSNSDKDDDKQYSNYFNNKIGTPPSVLDSQNRIESTKRILDSITDKKTDSDVLNRNIQFRRSSMENNTPFSLKEKEMKELREKDYQYNIHTGIKRPFSLDFCSDDSVWTKEIEDRFLDYIKLFQQSSDQCKKSSIFHNRVDWVLSYIIIILSSTLSAVGFIDSSNTDIISKFNIVIGIVIAVITGAKSKGNFASLSKIESEVCLELEKNARLIRIELSKKISLRVNPDELIVQLENKREKLLKKVNLADK